MLFVDNVGVFVVGDLGECVLLDDFVKRNNLGFI
jgi:hypothetical protein